MRKTISNHIYHIYTKSATLFLLNNINIFTKRKL